MIGLGVGTSTSAQRTTLAVSGDFYVPGSDEVLWDVMPTIATTAGSVFVDGGQNDTATFAEFTADGNLVTFARAYSIPKTIASLKFVVYANPEDVQIYNLLWSPESWEGQGATSAFFNFSMFPDQVGGAAWLVYDVSLDTPAVDVRKWAATIQAAGAGILRVSTIRAYNQFGQEI